MEKKVIGVCLIGCGRAGMIHARNYMNKVDHARMVAVVDVMEEAAKAAARYAFENPEFLVWLADMLAKRKY